ncbi:MAG: NAD(P)-binding domain-containing protein [Actinomycetota bacterium]|nr:NAD(P)-binding domain-containing protein [Actinomycetota bacterium]
MLEEGHEPACFERAGGLGGVFRFDENAGVVWESCRLTSSGLLTAFSDFPVPSGRAEHMSVGEYVDYLASYCDAFGVDQHIRFGTTVESVKREPVKGWHVRTLEPDGQQREERYDAVAVCSGPNQHPHRPHFTGQETFPGRILHSAQYRRPAQVAGKRVLIVGGGESGADIVGEISEHAAETVISLRRGVGVLPRTRHGQPNDYRTCRINNSAAHWIFETRNPADDWKRHVYQAVFLPLILVDKFIQTSALLIGQFRPLLPLLRPRRPDRGAIAETRVAFKTRRLTKQLLKESGGTLHEQAGTKSDDWVRAIAAGQCRRAALIARFDGRRVLFEDGSGFEPDLVILCTGFEVKVPFLDEAFVRSTRYLQTFVPSIGASLGFIGFVRPALGAIPPLAELQARWFASLLSGKSDLPTEEEMRASIDRRAAFRRHYFRAVPGRLEYLVDYTSLCDELASMVGCKPNRDALRQESLRFRLHFMISPFVAAQYRLVGPHAKPAITRQVITDLPVAYPVHALATFYLRWTLSRALHRLLGPKFAPKLVLQ